jgi:hypothetical protein
MTCVNWQMARYCVLGKEREIDIIHNLNIKVYGASRQGYEFLSKCLYGNCHHKNIKSNLIIMSAKDIWNGVYGKNRKQLLRKQMYEYWIFLNIVDKLLHTTRLNQRQNVYYQPCKGGNQQGPVVSINNWYIFVEPSLLPCSRNQIISKIQMHVKQDDVVNNLVEYLTNAEIVHNTPDFLISKVDKLIWGALRIFGMFGDRDIEENYQKREDWQKWKDYWDSIRSYSIIIECKNKSINIDDLAQVLWYKLCYDCEMILISQEAIPQNYKSILQNCNIYIIEDCKICDDDIKEKLNVLTEILGKKFNE